MYGVKITVPALNIKRKEVDVVKCSPERFRVWCDSRVKENHALTTPHKNADMIVPSEKIIVEQ
jgi:hypothetical protein